MGSMTDKFKEVPMIPAPACCMTLASPWSSLSVHEQRLKLSRATDLGELRLCLMKE